VVRRVSDLEQSFHAADTFAAQHMSLISIRTAERWRQAPPSPRQLKILNKRKIRDGSIEAGDLTRGQAADMLTKLHFGTKGRFQSEQKKKKKEEKIRKEFEKQMNQGDVRVGPVIAPDSE
jgi:ATP-dependent helicase IRC3